MGNFTRLHKIVILIIVILLISILGVSVFSNNEKTGIQIEENGLFSDDKKSDDNELFFGEDNDKDAEEKEEISTEVVVHITGEVAKPGVVILENGDRVIDAIKRAGGLLPSADESNINLAQKLFDEDKVIIPRVGDNLGLEHESFNFEGALESDNASKETIISRNSESSSSNNSSSSSSNGGGININTASKEELKSLPGIGEVTSQKIIDYRESTKFSSVDDIKNVSGIGEKKFEAIKSMITAK